MGGVVQSNFGEGGGGCSGQHLEGRDISHFPSISVSKGLLRDRSIMLWRVSEQPLPFCCILLHDVGPEAGSWLQLPLFSLEQRLLGPQALKLRNGAIISATSRKGPHLS